MTIATDKVAAGFRRHFTEAGLDVYESIDWELRDASLIDHREGRMIFLQTDVEVPVSWSTNATNILAQKYFRGELNSPSRESSLKQVVDRVVDTITSWGVDGGYFDQEEGMVFSDELKYLIITQRVAFNSPVWFNIGVADVPQQASACFILSVEDSMSSILNWYVEEGMIFKGGSGAGVNLSAIRSSRELLEGGGTASGPVSFMRGADASAGTIKSGGKTRRAAKMVILDIDHPDIQDFVWCKAREEAKMRALEAAGFDMGLDGADSHSIQYQNANNSVRVSDAFMEAVVQDREWQLRAVADGVVVETVSARSLFRQIAKAAWECADPGIQFDSTINAWNTAANTGRITASNPCSEYVHLDNSACNLASLNLLSFLGTVVDDSAQGFDVSGFLHAVEVMFTAQDILVGNADYPTSAIAETTRAFRQLGLGYANLGALLMALGVPYDSDEGRSIAGALTSLMTGHAYLTSARIAERLGPFDGYLVNREPTLAVLKRHQIETEVLHDAAASGLVDAARRSWSEAYELAEQVGVRNSQATVLAPTGTIGLLMDCDTTGIEPDLSLIKTKRLVGGGTMSIVNRTVPRALECLGYKADTITTILSYIDKHQSVIGCSELRAEHLSVFSTSMGDNPIPYLGHIRMMASVQPFLSGAISKTCNMPEDATVDEVEDLFIEAWRRGLKAVAIYRDNCKVVQPLTVGRDSTTVGSAPRYCVTSPNGSERLGDPSPVRRHLPRSRQSRTFEFRVADCKGFATVGEYEDGQPGEIFVRVSKQGSTMAGIMDAFAISLSHGLQYGVPLRVFVKAFTGMRFEPAGITDDPELRIATSIIDYLFRWLAVEYLSLEERLDLNILTSGERTQPTLPGVEESTIETRSGSDISSYPTLVSDAPLCMQCGVAMQRAGSCYLCADCGATSGCS